MTLEPGTPVDRYRVVRFLGSGGMADVYLVRHESLGALRALKVVRAGSAALAARLLQEGRTQAALPAHPNLVAVIDVIELPQGPGLVVEYVEGPTLQGLLAQVRLSPAQAVELGGGIILGVAAAHRAGLVHRDLKPANVLVEIHGGTLRPRISDFGLAKILETGPGATRTGIAMGTPGYMAPEQARHARDVDGRADVYGLGAVLYEVLSGCAAFAPGDLLAVLRAQREAAFRPLREVAPWLDAERARLVEACLAADPADRPGDADALLAAWGAVPPADWDDLPARLGAAPPAAPVTWSGASIEPPPASDTRTAAPSRRRGPAVVALVVGLIALALGGFVSRDAILPAPAPAPAPAQATDPRLAEAAGAVMAALLPGTSDDATAGVIARALDAARSGTGIMASRPSLAVILAAARARGLPDVVVGIPYAESGLVTGAVSTMCAAGPWQFMPETAVNAGLVVADCMIEGRSEAWSPEPGTPVRRVLPYADLAGGRCLMQSCRVDERFDLARSTDAALRGLAEVWNLGIVAAHQERVALTVAAHTVGVENILRLLGRADPVALLSGCRTSLFPGHQDCSGFSAEAAASVGTPAAWAAAALCTVGAVEPPDWCDPVRAVFTAGANR